MNNIRKALLVCVALVTPFASAQWLSPDAFWSIGLKVGSTGLGGEVSYHFKDHLALRIGYNTFSFKIDDEDFEEDISLKFSTIPLVLDWYPGMKRFRLSAGFYSNNSLFRSEDPGGVTELKYDNFSPYIGLGWGMRSQSNRLSVSADIGLLFQGSGRVTGTGPDALENIETMKDIASVFSIFPVLSVGLTYRF